MSNVKEGHITKTDIELGIAGVEEFTQTILEEKYLLPGEQNKQDMLDRVGSLIPTEGLLRGYPATEVKTAGHMVTDGYFLPAGSVLAGLGNTEYASSISNCYVTAIEQDSIEGFYDAKKWMAKTYSYRGGCGTDITILRPNGSTVSNSARSSSGAVSFMPEFSMTTETVGQHGRRGACLISIDCRHPDVMRFIWAKTDPERVFPKSALNQTSPTIDGANISVKITDEFIQAVLRDDTTPWKCVFPCMEDKAFYAEHWKGDYESWVEAGGRLVTYDTYKAVMTEENKHRFLGHTLSVDKDKKYFNTVVDEELLSKLPMGKEHTFVIPTAKQIFTDIATAAHGRGDPGVMFIDTIHDLSFTEQLDSSLRVLTTNPCGEQPLPPENNCLLGAHILSKYVSNPWTPDAKFDFSLWDAHCRTAVTLMNVLSDISEDRHPLQKQRNADKYSKRIGIEFLGMADMLSMLGLSYTSEKALEIVDEILHRKAVSELAECVELAKELGPCPAADPNTNPEGLERVANHEYIQRLTDGPNADANNIAKSVIEDLKIYGLRNAALNTVGPTGSLSLISDNASSGIEPILAFEQVRYTRIGGKDTYRLIHAPIARHLLTHWDVYFKDRESVPSTELKELFHVIEAHDVDPETRIKMQSVVQKWTDCSISSTVNLPEDCTVEDIVNIYLKAATSGLKGITVFRNNSLKGVINAKKDIESESEQLLHTEYSPGVRVLGDVEQCMRHRVVWNKAKLYIIVTLDAERNPIEVFVKVPREIGEDNSGIYNEQVFQEKFSLWETVTRLVSLCLRGNLPVSDVLKQLRKSSYVINDPMAIMIRVLSQYDTSTQVGPVEVLDETNPTDVILDDLASKTYTDECPVCHKKSYVMSGGCGICHNPDCKYTKCS